MSEEATLSKVERFLAPAVVLHLTGWSQTTLWREIQAGRFPKSIQISPGRVGWLESEVAKWQQKLIQERDNPPLKAKKPPKRIRA